ncbi:NAD(P)-dependent oxidoreductase [Balamuthia mandrillaris]
MKRELPQRVFIVGCGATGKRLAALWGQKGATVTALARSPESEKQLQALGIGTVPGDLDKPESLAWLGHDGATLAQALCYYLVPPPFQSEGEEDSRMQTFLRAIPKGKEPSKLVYMSTTGVYGDLKGGSATEATPLHPLNARSQRRISAENAIKEWSQERGIPFVILRAGGIYGIAERLPLDRISNKEPTVREEEAPWVSMIHIDDLAELSFLAGRNSAADCQVYNCVAPKSSLRMCEFYNLVAEAMGLEKPPTITMEEARKTLSPVMMSFLVESRVVVADKVVGELGYEFRYPDVRSGLQAISAS